MEAVLKATMKGGNNPLKCFYDFGIAFKQPSQNHHWGRKMAIKEEERPFLKRKKRMELNKKIGKGGVHARWMGSILARWRRTRRVSETKETRDAFVGVVWVKRCHLPLGGKGTKKEWQRHSCNAIVAFAKEATKLLWVKGLTGYESVLRGLRCWSRDLRGGADVRTISLGLKKGRRVSGGKEQEEEDGEQRGEEERRKRRSGMRSRMRSKMGGISWVVPLSRGKERWSNKMKWRIFLTMPFRG